MIKQDVGNFLQAIKLPIDCNSVMRGLEEIWRLSQYLKAI
jgi:hypothetical protein